MGCSTDLKTQYISLELLSVVVHVPCAAIPLQLRHPNILAVKDSIEVQEKGQHVIYIVTEAVRPLITVLKELNLSGKHRQAARQLWALCQALRGVCVHD